MNIFNLKKKKQEVVAAVQEQEIKLKGTHKLYSIMRHHIGEDNKVFIRDLFEEFFEVEASTLSNAEIFFMQAKLQSTINYLRRKTYMFIVSKDNYYFVVTSEEEAEQYRARLINTKQRITQMLARLDRAINEEFYNKLGTEQRNKIQ